MENDCAGQMEMNFRDGRAFKSLSEKTCTRSHKSMGKIQYNHPHTHTHSINNYSNRITSSDDGPEHEQTHNNMTPTKWEQICKQVIHSLTRTHPNIPQMTKGNSFKLIFVYYFFFFHSFVVCAMMTMVHQKFICLFFVSLLFALIRYQR